MRRAHLHGCTVSRNTHKQRYRSLTLLFQLPLLGLLLHAAAARFIFGHRSMGAHYLQPPAALGITPSQRAIRLATQLWKGHVSAAWMRPQQKQRKQLLCFSCLLDSVVARLCFFDRGRSNRRAAALVMRRCLSMRGVHRLLHATNIWGGWR
jgi:hypothetical protein